NVAYVGVSLDGISKIYDEFRRKGGLLLRRREQQTRHAWISIPFAGCLTDAERSSIKLVNYTGG
ncbi:MAG: hypothetical protein KDK97_19375, partial [Verrucomicrobiales bacterium]|nr:hypothetical protein [Verrucomicrobiales bacterium]